MDHQTSNEIVAQSSSFDLSHAQVQSIAGDMLTVIVVSYLMTGFSVFAIHLNENKKMRRRSFLRQKLEEFLWPWFAVKESEFGWFLAMFLGTIPICWAIFFCLGLIIKSSFIQVLVLSVIMMTPIFSFLIALISGPIFIHIIQPLGGRSRTEEKELAPLEATPFVSLLSKFYTSLCLVPFASGLGLLTFIFATSSWWLLLSLPVVLAGYALLPVPNDARSIPIFLIFGGLIYLGFLSEMGWVFALSLTMGLNWLSNFLRFSFFLPELNR